LRTGYWENIWEQGTERIFENRGAGGIFENRGTGGIFENMVLGEYLRTGYWGNI
jgi:hypothetical protein